MTSLQEPSTKYVIVWPYMQREAGVQILVKEMTDKLIENGKSVAVICNTGEYSRHINERAEIFDLRGRNELSEVKSSIVKCTSQELRIIAFDATSAALAAKVMQYAVHSEIQVKLIVGVYQSRTFLQSSRVLGVFSRSIAIGLGFRSIYFMNDECRRNHEKHLRSNFLESEVILLPVLSRPLQEHLLKKNDQCVRIVSVGRITASKAYNFAARRIVERLALENISVTWDIFGWGEDADILRHQLRRQSAVNYRGRIETSEMEAMVRGYDLFVGMGMSAIRAARLGVPTILAAEGHADLCYGYAYCAPDGNVGETPDSTAGCEDLASVIKGFSQMSNDCLEVISKKCSRWSEQFDYTGFIEKLDLALSESRLNSKSRYIWASRLLLLYVDAKRIFNSSAPFITQRSDD